MGNQQELTDFYAAVINQLKENYPNVPTVMDYEDFDEEKSIQLPAIFVNLFDEFEKDTDLGTNQLSIKGRCEAFVCFSFKERRVKTKLKQFCANLADFIDGKTWGMEIGMAEFLGCYPDDLNNKAENLVVRKLEWNQTIYIGDNIWDNSETIPNEIYTAYSPEIGPENINKYSEVNTDGV